VSGWSSQQAFWNYKRSKVKDYLNSGGHGERLMHILFFSGFVKAIDKQLPTFVAMEICSECLAEISKKQYGHICS